jgi:hypothetical protein
MRIVLYLLLTSQISTISTALVHLPSLPRHLVNSGMTLAVDDWDAPRVGSDSGWALSLEGHPCPQIDFNLLLAGEVVCTAKVVGSTFPLSYGDQAEILKAHGYRMSTHRTLVLSHLATKEAYRRQGCATAVLKAMEVRDAP